MQTPAWLPRALGNRPFLHQWLVWLALVLAWAALMLFMQWREYRSIARDEQAHLQTQVLIAERVLTGQIASVDAALRTMIASLDRWRGADGYLPFAQEHLRRVEAMMPGSQAFLVLDATGTCLLSSSPDLMGLNFSRSAFFAEARAGTNPRALYIPAPLRSVLGVWSVTIARPFFSPDGKFQGVVAAMLAPDYFQSLMSRLRYTEDMRVALIHGGGLIYVSSPPGDELYQTNFADGESFFTRHRASGREQSYQQGIVVGGTERAAMLQTVTLPDTRAGQSFVAVASRDLQAMYAQWRRDSLIHMAFVLGAAVLSALALRRYQKGALALQQLAWESEQAVQRSNRRFQQVADTIPSVLFDFAMAPTGRAQVLYVSPYSQQLLGSSPEQLTADPMRMLRHIHSRDGDSIRHTLQEAVRRELPFDCEFRYTPPEGSERWIRMSATPATDAQAGALPHWSGYLVDITDAKHHQQTLQALAYQDALTGAANRRCLMERLQAELARVQRTHASASLIMLDVDHFKRINDNFGHDAGDEVLKHLVNLLQSGLRSIDTLGRLGGEEFAILLPETPTEAASALAERLRQRIEQAPVTVGTQTIHVTVSLGVAPLHAQVADFNEAIKRADGAMYRAKESGRNQVCCA